MIAWTFIIGPIVGGIIGGFTNKVAIKMLFRPHTAKYVGRVHIPLTPGIIPKEKGRIARAIGDVVSDNLLSPDVLSQSLLSDDMLDKVGGAIDDLFDRMRHDPQTLRDFALQYLNPDELNDITVQTETDITDTLYTKLADTALGYRVADMVIDQVSERLQQSLLGRLGATVLDLLRDSTRDMLAKNINEMLHNNARQMVGDMVHTESERLQAIPIQTLVQGRDQQLSQAKGAIMRAYRMLVTDNLPKILATLDLRRIIEDRINDMDMDETETLILTIMDKELKALVWFGVLLGFLMGFVTNLV